MLKNWLHLKIKHKKCKSKHKRKQTSEIIWHITWSLKHQLKYQKTVLRKIRKKLYQQLSDGTEDDGIKFSSIWVGDESSNDGSKVGESRPSVDQSRSLDLVHMIFSYHIHHEIRHQSKCRKPLQCLIPYIINIISLIIYLQKQETNIS